MPPLSLTGTTFSASFSSSSSFSLLKCKGLHHRRRLSSPHCVVFFGVPRTSRLRRKHTNTNWKNKAATLRSSKNDSFFFNDDENENENETNENTNEENVEDDDFVIGDLAEIDMDIGAAFGVFALSGVVAYICITAFVRLVNIVGMMPFVVYRLLLGVLLFAFI